MIGDLPDEILVHILSFLTLTDLRTMLEFFPYLNNDEPLWNIISQRELGYLVNSKTDEMTWRFLGSCFLRRIDIYHKLGSVLIHLKDNSLQIDDMTRLIASIGVNVRDHLFSFVCINGVFSYVDDGDVVEKN